MKILVAGCSFSCGIGFASSLQDERIWPNLLGKKLNAEVTNVGVPAYDNPGIFLNALQEMTANKYDLILIQVTALNRVVVSPSSHGIINLMAPVDIDYWKGRINKSDYKNFCQTFITINQDIEHWRRLQNIIITVQNLVSKGYNIKFVNGLLHWTDDFFKNDRSKFGDQILNVDTLPDDEIALGVELLNYDKKQIDLDLWINPFNNFWRLKTDDASSTDPHPGINSQKIFSELIFNHLQQNSERK
jgi:hypothetical protein